MNLSGGYFLHGGFFLTMCHEKSQFEKKSLGINFTERSSIVEFSVGKITSEKSYLAKTHLRKKSYRKNLTKNFLSEKIPPESTFKKFGLNKIPL